MSTTREEALQIIWERCQHSKETEEALEVLKSERPHGKCKTCKHFVKGGLDGKTYVCEHPDIVLDDHFDYACIEMNEDDFCSRYVPREGDPDDQ